MKMEKWQGLSVEEELDTHCLLSWVSKMIPYSRL
jgi:hypothetical protein